MNCCGYCAVVHIRRVVRADGSDVCGRHRRQLPVDADARSRPVAADLRHQVPAHDARCRWPRVPPACHRRRHAAGLLRLRQTPTDVRHASPTSHPVSESVYRNLLNVKIRKNGQNICKSCICVLLLGRIDCMQCARCGQLLQMSHVPWIIRLSVCVCVCVGHTSTIRYDTIR